MREFSRPSGLQRLSLEARVVYSLFCMFMLIGYGTSMWLYHDDGLGVRPSQAAQYYLGQGTAPQQGGHGDDGGPGLDLPAEGDPMQDAATQLRFAKPARQIVETLHFHLFSVPVCLLIISHLFMMCAMSRAWKLGWIGAAWAATLLHLVVPPLLLVSAKFAPLMFPSAVAMTITWVYLTLWPVYEMWWVSAMPGERAAI